MTAADAPSYAFPDGVLAREVDAEMVLLNLNDENYYGLDPVGASIVTRLTREPEEQAIAALAEDYDVELPVLRADVDRLVHELLQAGLLERRSAS
ncbi:PqqD family protein [Blastococcus sp. SYSU D00820]